MTRNKFHHVFFVLVIFFSQFHVPAYADKLQDNALFMASLSGNVDEIKQLLASGANINAKRVGDQPIHYGARSGNTEVVKVLLAAGAKVDALSESGYQPIHFAAQTGNIDVVKFLLSSGAKADVSVSASNKYGGQPIHFAAQSGNAELVKLLLEAGAKADAKDNSGHTPYSWISQKGNPEEVKNVLIASGAKTVPTADEELMSKLKPIWLEHIGPQLSLGVWDKMMIKKNFTAKYVVKCETGKTYSVEKTATVGDPPESWQVTFPHDFYSDVKGLDIQQAYGCGLGKLTWTIYADGVLIDSGTLISERKGSH